ncbi:MAG: M67 family metallopeptidase [Chloroflexota bacterium]
MRVARAAYEAMVAHAQAERPFEACGVMAGSGGIVTEVHRMRNVAELFGVRYEMDPKEFLRVNNAIDDADLDLIGVYHSHPFTRAYPSATDMAQAWEGLVYAIVSLRDFLTPEARAFTIANGEVSEQPVEIVDAGE